MNDPIRTIHGKHATASIIYDEGPGWSPREWSNIGTIAMRSKPRTSIIDPQNGDEEYADLYDQLLDMVDEAGVETTEILRNELDYPEDPDAEQEAKDAIWDAASDRYAMLALQLRDYGTGQLRLWADGDFDGCDGIVYVRMSKAWEEAPIEDMKVAENVREWAELRMKEEIETFEQYLNGAVYGIIIERDGKHEDSCFGFYGDPHEEGGYIEQEAREMLEHVDARLARRYIYDPLNMTPFGGRHNTYV